MRAGRVSNNRDQNFYPIPNYYISIMNIGLAVFFLIDNLPRIKDGAYMINLDDKQSKGTQLVSVFIGNNLAMYFDSFEVEYIPQQVQNKIKDKSIAHNIVRILDDNYVMCRINHKIYASQEKLC